MLLILKMKNSNVKTYIGTTQPTLFLAAGEQSPAVFYAKLIRK